MADSAPTQRRVPVGYRFHPTEKELVAHYLRRKLKADDPSVHDTIPEIDVCKNEPWDILAALATKFDDSECFFFSPYDYKYSNSTRRNRATLHGFWKVTGRGGKVIDQGTNNVIGTKKTLVFYQGHVLHGCKTNWVIHEYHDAMLPSYERTHALCWLKKNPEKKIKEKTCHLLDDKRESNNIILEYENQANTFMNSRECHFSSVGSNIQTPSQSNETISSLKQTPSQPNEIISSLTQTLSQPKETINSIVLPSQSNKVTDPMVPTLSNEVRNSMSQIPSKSIEFESIDSVIQTLFQLDEMINSTLLPNSIVETPFDM